MSSQSSNPSDPPNEGHGGGQPSDARTGELKGRTLPPPWGGGSGPLSVTTLTLEQQRPGAPVSRRKGPHAELATFEAQLRAAAASGDLDGERLAAMALSRALAARGAELDTATKLARRALVLGEDQQLRTELSTWFAGLGEPALAAATLRPVLAQRTGLALSRVLTRIAVLLARAGDAKGAAEALREATKHADADPLPPELLGAVGAWAPDSLSAESAALSYVEGSRRRERSGEKAAAFEDLLRAFEAAPQCAEAAQALHKALTDRGRSGAADEVLREHARALLDEQADQVHLKRMSLAAKQGEYHRAVGAGLDARLESQFDVERATLAVVEPSSATRERELSFEALLDEVGLHDLLAVRLDVAADTLEGAARAAARAAAARIYAGKLARPTRAVQAWLDALLSDPTRADAREALRVHAQQTMDVAPLVEGLIRVIQGPRTGEAWSSAAEELVRLAEERLSDPGLAAWAARRLVDEDAGHSLARQALERLAPRVRLQNEALRAARAQVEKGEDRTQALVRLASILVGRPDEAEELIPILAELDQHAPGQLRWRQQHRLILERLGRLDQLDQLLSRLISGAHTPEKEALLLERARLARERQDFVLALKHLRPWLSEGHTHSEVSALALVLATRVGDDRARAQALVKVSAPLTPPLRATLMSIAVEALLAAGDREQAAQLAEQACHADPSRTRPVAARALAVADLGKPDQVALERAVGVVVPRTSICTAIADAYEAEGADSMALAWTQRQLALRPGDLRIAEVLLRRVTRAGDAARLSDALAWLLSQPEPLERLAAPIARALRALADLDPERGAALARRTLDVLGPRVDDLRETILEIADAVGERGLAIAVIERWLASGAPGEFRGEVLLNVARRRRAAGDADGAARALGRALREGVEPEQVQRELDQSPEPRGSDGILALLEVRAEVLSATAAHDLAEVSLAWRRVGAARWDLAQDRAGAFEAWERAATLMPETGYPKLAADLLEFAGPDAALQELERLAETRQELDEQAHILAVAAGVALEAGRLRDALSLGARALAIDPSRTDVLAIVERSARSDDIATLDQVYHRLAERALGNYGVRSAHYRAARQMEQRKEPERAFVHALKAFEAVPTEGVAFVMLVRLVQSLGKTSELVRVLERVAQESDDKVLRSRWLKRAAMFADDSAQGARQRLDVLLRALAISADLETLQALGEALSAALQSAPEDREILELRYARALDSMLSKAQGYQGALLLIHGARIAVGQVAAVRPALAALHRALGCEPSLPDYTELLPYTRELATHPELANELVGETLRLADEEFSGVGSALLELGAELAAELGREQDSARLFVAAAERRPDDTDLVRKAERLAHRVGDQGLLDQVLQAVPARERLAGLFEIASQCQKAGQLAQAIDALRRALEIEGLSSEEHSLVQEHLAEAYRAAGHHSQLEALLQARLDKDDLTPELRANITVELAALIGTAGDPERALRVLAPIARERQDKGLLGDMAALAKQAGDQRAQAEALDMMVDHEQDPEARLELLRELAGLLQELGDEATALARYQEVLRLSPNDPLALSAMEREAERRGDYETVADILARRAAVAQLVDDVRRIHLHRAMVLEQRLARPEDAREELEALLAATGDNLNVLRVLADLNERMSDPARAAQLWLRASGIAKDKAEAADLAFRSCEAQLAAGDVGAARRVLEGIESWSQNLRWRELKVEVERHSEDPFALGHAIEELALASNADPEERARLLVEAAQTALAAGDAREAARRSEIAARLAPTHADAQLLKHTLAYRRGGAGDAEQARLTILALRGIVGELSPEQEELRSFLLAEALDVVPEEGSGLEELESVLARLGPRPLIALGVAERAARAKDFQRAQRFYERALSGDFRDLRNRAEAALNAATTARALGELELALVLAESAARDPKHQSEAAALIEQLRTQGSGPPPASLQEPPEVLTRRSFMPQGDDSAASAAGRPDPVVEIARPVRPGRELAHTMKSKTGHELLLQASETDSAESDVAADNAREHGAPLEHAETAAESEHAESEHAESELAESSERAAQRLARGSHTRDDSEPPDTPLPATRDSSPPDSVSRVSSMGGFEPGGVVRVPFAAPAPDEALLLDRLKAGDESAARDLIARLEGRSERTQDLVSVCRRLAKLKPGDPWTLQKLHDAADQDGNYAYSRALAHVIALFGDGSEVIEPPALRDQPEHPDAVKAMLFRDHQSPGAEALKIVWEGASHIFRRDPSTYGVTGLERVPMGAPTPLARVFSEAARAMGMTRTPMFQRRSAGSVTISLALLSPPALILSGEVAQETPTLRFYVGSMLAAAWPEHVLLFGAGEAPVKSVLQALLIAFGPPRTNNNPQNVANLAEVLWESIPAGGQRQLRQLCDDPTLLDYATVVQAARGVQRRAGLFVSGDLGVSLKQLMQQESLGLELPASLDELARLCREQPAVADLVKLATSPEYAEVRWQSNRAKRS